MLISGQENCKIVLWHLRVLPTKFDATILDKVISGSEKPFAPEIGYILAPYKILDSGLPTLAPITTMLWLDSQLTTQTDSLCQECLKDRQRKSEATCFCDGALVVGHGKQVSISVDYLCVACV